MEYTEELIAYYTFPTGEKQVCAPSPPYIWYKPALQAFEQEA